MKSHCRRADAEAAHSRGQVRMCPQCVPNVSRMCRQCLRLFRRAQFFDGSHQVPEQIPELPLERSVHLEPGLFVVPEEHGAPELAQRHLVGHPLDDGGTGLPVVENVRGVVSSNARELAGAVDIAHDVKVGCWTRRPDTDAAVAPEHGDVGVGVLELGSDAQVIGSGPVSRDGKPLRPARLVLAEDAMTAPAEIFVIPVRMSP